MKKGEGGHNSVRVEKNCLATVSVGEGVVCAFRVVHGLLELASGLADHKPKQYHGYQELEQ